ncbi:MAG: Inner membrane protein YccF [Eubacteriales bacterium SKADARSKE-1]|nr:Inner membrane protein YccF [Eubacteriales bacterium SKADARSKE-1]
MKTLANILWIIFGGLILSIMWFISGFIFCITIIGIPFGIQCFKLAYLVLCPFGKQIYYEGGAGSFLLNILWIIFFGWELALFAVIIGFAWCITIIGIPVGIQCLKFAQLSFMPFGARVKQI